ncbi:heterokaryon incompatibility protein-domain-containing protein [Xylariaceae sp. FL1651]|nr:heterokaryon incompatibility protein-domain-containing protein [Xylariaceae sp. FL1651]
MGTNQTSYKLTHKRRHDNDEDKDHASTYRPEPLVDSDTCHICHDLQEPLRKALDNGYNQDSWESRYMDKDRPLGDFVAYVPRCYRNRSETSCKLCLMLQASYITAPTSLTDIAGCVHDQDKDELRVFPLHGVARFVRYWDFRKDGNIENDLLAVLIGPRHAFKNYNTVQSQIEYQNGILTLFKSAGTYDLFRPRSIHNFFEPDMIREWVEYCQKHHTICSSTSLVVRDLRLIDCLTRMVVLAENHHKYAALSYVWGTIGAGNPSGCDTTGTRTTPSQLPRRLPNVIEDAIDVTMSLGYCYLWVDKFCIDQTDHMKHDQIRQMDAIYERAEFTIIAACGSDQNDGLAGVSRSREGAQLTTLLGNARLVWWNDPHKQIRDSRWSSRGWTLQEGIFSRRRLVFTKEQVYFECSAMNCSENLHVPLTKLHVKTRTKMRDEFRGGMFGRGRGEYYGAINSRAVTTEKAYNRYWSCVEDYTARNLTYDKDVLFAFQGIIRRFRADKNRAVAAIQGMPYPIDCSPADQFQSWRVCLSWFHSPSSQTKRRSSFPSWTWAGWSGKVMEMRRDYVLGWTVGFRNIAFQDLAGVTLEFNKKARLDQKPERSTYQVLSIEAQIIPTEWFLYTENNSKKNPSRSFYGFKLEQNLETGASWRFLDRGANLYLSDRDVSHDQLSRELQTLNRWQCVYIGLIPISGISIMLLKTTPCGSWSRAGLFVTGCLSDDIKKALASHFGGASKWQTFHII